MLAEDNGTFRPVEVEIGLEDGGQTEVKRGLRTRVQRVVVSSQFLIDSEASLKGVATRLNAEPTAAQPPAPSQQHTGEAIVERVEADRSSCPTAPLRH
jgi:Cu(I)/Ag(I) efflux system membrane fusion protein